MAGKSLPQFPDEFRVRIDGNCVGAGTVLLLGPVGADHPRSRSPTVTTHRTAEGVRQQRLSNQKSEGEKP